VVLLLLVGVHLGRTGGLLFELALLGLAVGLELELQLQLELHLLLVGFALARLLLAGPTCWRRIGRIGPLLAGRQQVLLLLVVRNLGLLEGVLSGQLGPQTVAACI